MARARSSPRPRWRFWGSWGSRISYLSIMTERLIIRNFAGLREVDIELGRINIFIGPQASGKSVCAKCLYWFKSFLPELVDSAEAGQDKRDFEASYLERFKSYFPNLWRAETLFILRYEIGEYFVELTNEPERAFSSIRFSYSSFFDEAATEIRATIRELKTAYEKAKTKDGRAVSYLTQALHERSATAEPRSRLWEKTGEFSRADQSFVIAGRAFLSTLKGTILTFLASNPITDPLVRDFLRIYEQIRREPPTPETQSQISLFKLAESIIRGQLLIEGEDDYILLEDERRIPLVNASSGQQESFSLLMVLLDIVKHYNYEHVGTTLYIEEPEAHLFPESQRVLAQLMIQVYSQSEYPLQYVITTHSPYLLASFNNLVYAQQLAEKLHDQPAKLKALYKVVPKNQQLALVDVRVYGFENGTVKPLIDAETGLLSAGLLDSASDVTADQFGDLMALDPAIHS